MNHNITYAAACRDEIGEAGVPSTGRAGFGILRRVTHGEQLHVVLVIYGDGVVRALAGVHAACVHIEAEFAVLRDALFKIGHANHDVVDAGEHGPPWWSL